MLLQDLREDVRDQVDALLHGPAADEDEELGVGVDFEASPLLGFFAEAGTRVLHVLVDADAARADLVAGPVGGVSGIGVGEGADGFEAPEDWVPVVFMGLAIKTQQVLVRPDAARLKLLRRTPDLPGV